MSSELDRIALLRRVLASSAAGVHLGIGDDAAVLAPPREELVLTVDAAVEGVHFRRDLLPLIDVGYRATMAAASDLAAMGARPLGLVAALVLPASVSDADLEAIARGQREAADELATAIVGGNLARGTELSITTTALGAAARPLTRAGAREGDNLWAAGDLGLAGAGFRALSAGMRSRDDLARAINAWRRPRARIAEGLAAGPSASAAIDVSDGLARDVAHLAKASGVRALLEREAIVSAELHAAAAALSGVDPLDLALHGGEDYALLIALPPGAAPIPGFRRIGAFVADRGAFRVGVTDASGQVTPVDERGFDHFG